MSRQIESLSQGLSSCEEKCSLRLTLRRLLYQVHTESSKENIKSRKREFSLCRISMDEHLTNSKEANSVFGVKLFFAKLARARIEANDLRTPTNTTSRFCYNIGDEPYSMAFIEASDKLRNCL
ncbi:unnamed protein product [Lepeophtheirus salmonis]|uniref:(salmon louse) hypothetical protein n=1 Tax=Lepeophtheirus salmonis TaxID=72036 RepID=A0A7R8H859_LEPSM|nr:unnamed protein product [Lepeophtheirus salmonis]CAF2924203.1 unnamed protein product [Lepeophtheirus salmonis]